MQEAYPSYDSDYGKHQNSIQNVQVDTQRCSYSLTSLPFEKYFNTTDKFEWDSWLRRFERYRLSSRLVYEPDEVRVSVLLLGMGNLAEDIFESFSLDSPTYKTVIEHFNNFFSKAVNIVYERAKFNKRLQLEGESAEQYIVGLYSLPKTCNYGTLKDELIRDRLVIGVRDQQLSESLQMDPSLTLASAMSKVKLHESVKNNQAAIRNSPVYSDMDEVALNKNCHIN